MLREYLKSLKLRQPIDVLLSLGAKRLQEYVYRIVDGIEGLTLRFTGELPRDVRSGAVTVLVTDVEDAIPSVFKSDGEVDGDEEHANTAVIFLAYEISTKLFVDSATRPKVRFIKRPIKANALIKAIQECIIQVIIRSAHSSMNAINSTSTEANPKYHKMEATLAARCPLRILVADDNMLNQQLLGRVLQKYGYYDISFVENGQQALERVFSGLELGKQIELIFMDMQMPVLDGCTATLRLRAAHNAARHASDDEKNVAPHIIALTANAFIEDREACLKVGMCAYISKPVQWELLERAIEESYEAVHMVRPCRCNGLARARAGAQT